MVSLVRRSWPLLVRRARPDDEAAVLSFATTTWDGWDYMPHAWPRWLDAPDGVLLVGVAGEGADVGGGTVVAVVRMAMPAPGEAWLEGIRVDPRVRGLDVATDLQMAELHWAAAQGATVVRYATSAVNEGSQRLGARAGFELLTALHSTGWVGPNARPAHDDEPSGFLPDVQADARRRRHALLDALADAGAIAGPNDDGSLWSMISADPSFNAGARLYERRPWAYEELTQAKLGRHLAAGEVVVVGADENRAVGVLVGDVALAEDRGLALALLVGAPMEALDLVERARRLAGEPIRFHYPAAGSLVSSIEQRYRDAGYELSDWKLYIMARPIDAEHPLPSASEASAQLVDRPAPIVVPAQG